MTMLLAPKPGAWPKIEKKAEKDKAQEHEAALPGEEDDEGEAEVAPAGTDGKEAQAT